MQATDAPRAPSPPRFDDLNPTAELGPGQVGDDALVSGLQVASLVLDQHSSEFVEWSQCQAEGGTLADSTWYKPTWRDLSWVDVDAANAAVDEGSLARLEFSRSRLTGMVWSGSTLTDVSFTDCVLDLSVLRSCTLHRVSFVRCRLKSADVSMAKLTDVLFDECDLSEAQFHQARVLKRVRVQGSELTAAKGLVGLRGLVVSPTDLLAFAGQLAAEAGIVIDW